MAATPTVMAAARWVRIIRMIMVVVLLVVEGGEQFSLSRCGWMVEAVVTAVGDPALDLRASFLRQRVPPVVRVMHALFLFEARAFVVESGACLDLAVGQHVSEFLEQVDPVDEEL